MRSAVLWFETDGFVDTGDDIEQRINESIGGAALARWLAASLRSDGVHVVEPWAEDHGWDFDVKLPGAKYLVVCTIEDQVPREACIQVHLTVGGRAALDQTDPLLRLVMARLQANGHDVRQE